MRVQVTLRWKCFFPLPSSRYICVCKTRNIAKSGMKTYSLTHPFTWIHSLVIFHALAVRLRKVLGQGRSLTLHWRHIQPRWPSSRCNTLPPPEVPSYYNIKHRLVSVSFTCKLLGLCIANFILQHVARLSAVLWYVLQYIIINIQVCFLTLSYCPSLQNQIFTSQRFMLSRHGNHL